MLSVSTIARVIVSTVRAGASPSSFDTSLLLIKDSGYTAARRLQSYSSAAEAAAVPQTVSVMSRSAVESMSAISFFMVCFLLRSV